MNYLYILQQALIWTVAAFYAYQTAIGLCSLIKFKDKQILNNKKHKFMAIIPAHNEESVIKNLVDSLKNQNYDKDLYDIYVIADNCTDNTAKIAKQAGAIVYERFDNLNKTKGHALNWFIRQKIEENADYDAFFVFDADNIVDKNFILNMNKKLCQGEQVVQGYRDIKNPTDSWISSGYAIFYWTMHRFYHLARYNLGLSTLLNGTGFMVKFDLMKPNGWKTKTLTEDIEFSLQNIINGVRVGWATDAIVYDEQPVKFKPSWSQRSRWTVGHIQCLKEYTGKLANSVKEKKTLMCFDGLLYILGTTPIFIMTILVALIGIIINLYNGATGAEVLLGLALSAFQAYGLSIGLGLSMMFLEKKPIKPMVKGLITYPIFLFTWLLINAKCLVKRQTVWEKIEHVRNIKIGEVALK